MSNVHRTVCDALRRHGRLEVDPERVAPGDDLYAIGFTSHAAVNVMLAIEEELDLELPDELLTRETFGSIGRLEAVLAELLAERGDASGA